MCHILEEVKGNKMFQLKILLLLVLIRVCDFGIDDSFQNIQQSYAPIYQYPYFNSYNQYPSDQAPSNYQQSMNYEDPYYQQSSDGYVPLKTIFIYGDNTVLLFKVKVEA
ncbi:hypothetical protein P8452_26874 [Trifolium repens]|nr:hypothetical protein P8452_26874 [Trifolium repens]